MNLNVVSVVQDTAHQKQHHLQELDGLMVMYVHLNL